jgi:hypothetical protein
MNCMPSTKPLTAKEIEEFDELAKGYHKTLRALAKK